MVMNGIYLVIASACILMLGYQPRIFRTILNNTNKFGTLIILDRALYEYPHLVADDVQDFYLASDGNDISEEVPMSRRITYSGIKNIPFINSQFAKFDILFNGHTHLPHITRIENGSVIVNTGSPTFPKGGNPPTFATYEEGVISLYHLDGTLLDSLQI